MSSTNTAGCWTVVHVCTYLVANTSSAWLRYVCILCTYDMVTGIAQQHVLLALGRHVRSTIRTGVVEVY